MKYNNVMITGKSGTIGSGFDIGSGFGSKDYDMRSIDQTSAAIEKYNPDAIIHCACIVGGLEYHLKNKYSLFYDNNLINSNIIECARRKGVQRVLSFLSSCIYSDRCESPYNETHLFEHEPFHVHLAYGHSKRFLEIQSRFCYEEFGLKYNCIIPANVYGTNDEFNMEKGHVVGILIHKAYLAAMNGTDFFVWGDGNQKRQFLFVKDVVDITKWALDHYLDKEPLVVSNNELISVGEIAYLIAREFNIDNRIVFQKEKPSGQMIRSLDGSKLSRLNNFKFTPIDVGIKTTVDWFKTNYPNVRK
jgi:GDP-L-fucose synthase